jgi:hypothetical protein
MPKPTVFRRLGVLAAALALASCAVFDSPTSFTLGEAEVQALAERHFPLDRRLLDAFDVTISAPRVRLLPEHNRIATEVQIGTRDRLIGAVFGGALRGKLALDSQLRWEPSDQTLRLAQVRVQTFELGGGGAGSRATFERLGAVVAERVLEDFTIYRLPPERAARLTKAGVAPGSVAVTSRGIDITLAPTSR